MLRQCDSGENTAWAPCSLPGKFQWDTIRTQHSVRLAGKPGAPACPAPAATLPALPLPAEPALAARVPQRWHSPWSLQHRHGGSRGC